MQTRLMHFSKPVIETLTDVEDVEQWKEARTSPTTLPAARLASSKTSI
jgi:hypothetical protein